MQWILQMWRFIGVSNNAAKSISGNFIILYYLCYFPFLALATHVFQRSVGNSQLLYPALGFGYVFSPLGWHGQFSPTLCTA